MRIDRGVGLTLTIACVLIFNAIGPAEGAVPRGTLPGAQKIEAVQQLVMPEIDTAKLLSEDLAMERSGAAAPSRFAAPVPVAFSPSSAGTWEELDDGSRLWRLRIASPGALSLNLGIQDFDLPAGATFWVHDTDGAQVRGPYTMGSRNAAGGLWTAVVLGDELVAELHLPAGAEADLKIASVNHGYRFFGQDKDNTPEKRGSCNVNVVCPEGDLWRDQIRSVGRITISGMWLCTGQLINNTASDDKPLFLTAQHCIETEDEAPSVVAYWNYESPACDDVAGGSLSQNQSGSTWIASSPLNGGSDFTLVELDQDPDPSWNLYFTGWDAREQVPESTTTIHHPSGDEKSISFDYDPPTITSYTGDMAVEGGRFWRIADWDIATTEGGSSGGCLFDSSTKRCVGTLSGGYAACGNDEPDWYGRMTNHWTGDGTPDTRLSDWLDPENTGALLLEGKNAGSEEETWLIPAVASAPGEDPTYWSSEVAVVNPTDEDRTVSIYFVARQQAWPGVLLSGPHAVTADRSLYLADVLAGEAPASGMLYISVDGSGTAVSARTSTPDAGGGTYGQGQPGVSLSATASSTELILPMIHSAPGVFRTNIGFAQTSSGVMRVRVQIYSTTGSLLAQKEYSQSAAWRQVNDVFKDMGIGGQSVQGGWIRVTLVTGSPSFWTTYATVIDNSTDDPTYVMPVAP